MRKGGLEVFVAPIDVLIGEDIVMQPDVVVASTSTVIDGKIRGVPLLAVEVHSPNTRGVDLEYKRLILEEAGCQSFWGVDPLVATVMAWGLVDGAYVEVGHVVGDEVFEATLPFAISVVPSALVR